MHYPLVACRQTCSIMGNSNCVHHRGQYILVRVEALYVLELPRKTRTGRLDCTRSAYLLKRRRRHPPLLLRLHHQHLHYSSCTPPSPSRTSSSILQPFSQMVLWQRRTRPSTSLHLFWPPQSHYPCRPPSESLRDSRPTRASRQSAASWACSDPCWPSSPSCLL